MPKWVFNHAAGVFSNEDKQAIAQAMTKIYTAVGLPAFYCHVQFFELPSSSIYAGGEPQTALTTLSIYHIARLFQQGSRIRLLPDFGQYSTAYSEA